MTKLLAAALSLLIASPAAALDARAARAVQQAVKLPVAGALRDVSVRSPLQPGAASASAPKLLAAAALAAAQTAKPGAAVTAVATLQTGAASFAEARGSSELAQASGAFFDKRKPGAAYIETSAAPSETRRPSGLGRWTAAARGAGRSLAATLALSPFAALAANESIHASLSTPDPMSAPFWMSAPFLISAAVLAVGAVAAAVWRKPLLLTGSELKNRILPGIGGLVSGTAIGLIGAVLAHVGLSGAGIGWGWTAFGAASAGFVTLSASVAGFAAGYYSDKKWAERVKGIGLGAAAGGIGVGVLALAGAAVIGAPAALVGAYGLFAGAALGGMVGATTRRIEKRVAKTAKGLVSLGLAGAMVGLLIAGALIYEGAPIQIALPIIGSLGVLGGAGGLLTGAVGGEAAADAAAGAAMEFASDPEVLEGVFNAVIAILGAILEAAANRD